MRNNRDIPEELVHICSKLKAAAAAARDDELSIGIMKDAHCERRAAEERSAAYLHTARGARTWRATAGVRTPAFVTLPTKAPQQQVEPERGFR